jgi:hypothetical protein
LRYTTPIATNYEYPISAVPHDTPRTPQGPLALPGTYRVRLSADGKVLTAPLTVKMDPRVETSRADLETLFNLEFKLSGMVNSSSEAALQAHSIREQIEKVSKNASQELKESLEKSDEQLASLLDGVKNSAGIEEQPGLDDIAGEIAELYTQVGQVDAAPTDAQQEACTHVNEELAEVEKEWEKVKTSDLPELNHRLKGAHLPDLNLEQKPESMPESGDED